MKSFCIAITFAASMALAFSIGASISRSSAADNASAEIADSCQYSGHFTFKRRGFTCERVTK